MVVKFFLELLLSLKINYIKWTLISCAINKKNAYLDQRYISEISKNKQIPTFQFGIESHHKANNEKKVSLQNTTKLSSSFSPRVLLYKVPNIDSKAVTGKIAIPFQNSTTFLLFHFNRTHILRNRLQSSVYVLNSVRNSKKRRQECHR